MAELRTAIYFDGKSHIECRVKKVGAKNTRIVFNDGNEELVPSSSVKVEISVIDNDSPERIVPTIPLELLYRPLRKLNGSKGDHFHSLSNLLNDRHGPKGAVFLAELFLRSVQHAESYSNIRESFHSDRKERKNKEYSFANDLVQRMKSGTPIQAKNQGIEFVDYEIFPLRTTRSCCENGKPARSIGSGGMDLLLASTMDDSTLPAIGEIKAASETVGPTFALVQSLMYAAQLATRNQFLRLQRQYEGAFATINARQPRLDLIVLVEDIQKLNKKDLDYALSLAGDLVKSLETHLRCHFAGELRPVVCG